MHPDLPALSNCHFVDGEERTVDGLFQLFLLLSCVAALRCDDRSSSFASWLCGPSPPK
jgi:hypothetical protein